MSETNKIFAVVDTNVIVSSFLSRDGSSNPAKIIVSIIEGTITPLYNDEILAEYFEVLSRPRFHFSHARIIKFISLFRNLGINTNRTVMTDEIFPDPDDAVFYEVKMSVDDSYLVTGNLKHFPN
ncbi:MAG: putative toxin-antitoxin system toxin component, PIN family, partial [Muribaculaceae bacterium]|nr:putative toxin-antitoxin system toxin component, PIN family [Muribaculaceae bacterium]